MQKTRQGSWQWHAVALSMLFYSQLAQALEEITLRLRWVPQYQFAGYYMALEKGFYAEAGFDVRIVTPEQGMPGTIEHVLSGGAEFGVANSGIVRERAAGKPLVALAAVGQHAPSVWLVRADSGIASLDDLVGKRLMSIAGDHFESIELFAPFLLEGIRLDQLKLIPTSYQAQSLINGETDALNAYITNEPFEMMQAKVDYRVIRPSAYGVDFYSDILFTTEQQIAEHPERVQAFLQASLKGWRYAVEHVDETVNVLHRKYATHRSLEHLRYEAQSFRELINPDVISIGHMNLGRWQHIAQMHREMGLLQGEVDWQRFIYQGPAPNGGVDLRALLSVAAVALFMGLLALWYWRWNARLRYEIGERRKAEDLLRMLATTDELTGLANRRNFFGHAVDEFNRANRYTRPLCLLLLDLDLFKLVNDDYGHQMGDQALRQMGQVFKVVLRHSDIAGRIGGEEFAVLLPETELAVAEQVAERLRATVANSTVELPGSAPCQITVSIGVTAFASSDDEFEQMYNRADTALYAAKNNGRDQVQVQT